MEKYPIFSLNTGSGPIWVRGDCVNAAEFAADYPQEMHIVVGLIAHGGGVFIRRGQESHWLPAATVRGHRSATEKEIAEQPDWVQNAYRWYAGPRTPWG